LGRQGITVLGTPRPVGTDQTGSDQSAAGQAASAELAAVQSAPLGQIVQWVLEVSDNEAAEVLFRQVAVAEALPASFDGGARAVHRVLRGLGVDTSGDRILDGSGLSRSDRLRPETLLAVLALAAGDAHPGLRPAASGMPVAGFSGSLAHRFDTGDALGLGAVRAKTGTLTGVQGLAGYVTDADGTVMTFVVVADRIRPPNTLDARARIDEIAAALAGCECGA
jgi:D-alanyl-D-alanine carboxypeptidase/D-alanyl-D-alanine-endopeptidase (penicillin-binding protein 4)